MKFIDILQNQKENSVAQGAGSRQLSEEQKQDESLNHWMKLAEENKSGFFVENDLLFRNERILGHSHTHTHTRLTALCPGLPG